MTLGRASSSRVRPAGSRIPRTNSSPSSKFSTPASPPCAPANAALNARASNIYRMQTTGKGKAKVISEPSCPCSVLCVKGDAGFSTSRRFLLVIWARQISASASRYDKRKCCTPVQCQAAHHCASTDPSSQLLHHKIHREAESNSRLQTASARRNGEARTSCTEALKGV